MALDVLTGARARFSLNGVVVALATRWSMQEQIDYQAVQTLDNIEDQDHIPVGYTVSFQASEVRIINQTVVALGFMPAKGLDAAAHLRNILTQEDLTAQLEDNQTDQVIARLTGVKLSSRSLAVDARGMAQKDLSFVARRHKDEAETT